MNSSNSHHKQLAAASSLPSPVSFCNFYINQSPFLKVYSLFKWCLLASLILARSSHCYSNDLYATNKATASPNHPSYLLYKGSNYMTSGEWIPFSLFPCEGFCTWRFLLQHESGHCEHFARIYMVRYLVQFGERLTLHLPQDELHIRFRSIVSPSIPWILLFPLLYSYFPFFLPDLLGLFSLAQKSLCSACCSFVILELFCVASCICIMQMWYNWKRGGGVK